MSLKAIVETALEQTTAAGACAVDAVLVEGDAIEARVREASVDFVKQAREKTLGIRAFVSGEGGLSSAITSTSDLSPETVSRMAKETVALANATEADPCAGLPEGGFATEVPDLALFAAEDRSVGVDAHIDCALRAEAAARSVDERITNSEGSQIDSSFGTVVYGNSAGFLESYESASHSLFSEPIAQEGDAMQRDYWMTVARSLDDLEDPESVGRTAAERALRRLGGRRVPTCEVPILFESRTAPSILGHLLACLNGYSIYRESSYLAGKLGERIANELVNVIDDGTLPGRLGSKPFDGEGQPTRRNVLVENGVLESYILDTYSARKLGMKTTGNAARSAGSGPMAAPSNVWLEAGDTSFAEMVAQTKRGLLVTELIGMGFNPVTGDYSRGAAGLWIENGEIAYPVEEITIAGNLANMLGEIDAVGNELHWFGRTASPEFRIAKMTVAGS